MSAYDAAVVAELLALDEKRTPGEWVRFFKRKTIEVQCADPKQPIVHWMGFDCADGSVKQKAFNAAFIAAAPRMVQQLRAASERISQLERALEQAAQIAEQQPFYPDTRTGMRQQWVKGQIAAKIRALAGEAG